MPEEEEEDEHEKMVRALRPGAGSPLSPQEGPLGPSNRPISRAPAPSPRIYGSTGSPSPPEPRYVRSDLGQDLHNAYEQADWGELPPPPTPPSDPPRPEPEPPPSPKAGSHEHHPTTKTLDYLGLGIILAPAPEVIAMYLRHEDIDWRRVVAAFLVSTVIGSSILWFAHGWRKTAGGLAALRGYLNRADDYFWVRAIIIVFFMISPVLIAPLISGAPVQPSPAQPGFTQRQVDEKIAAATAPIQQKLDEANRQAKTADEAARKPALPSAPTSISPPSPITNASIGPGFNIPLELTGTFLKGGKILKYVVDFTFNSQNREKGWQPHTRFKIGESRDFVRGEAVKLPILSYLNADRTVLKWGTENQPPLPGTENGTVGFTYFVEATVLAVDEAENETKIIAFVLWPRMSGSEFNGQQITATRDPNHVVAQPATPTWRDMLVLPEGKLRSLDFNQ
jgi:hypothetical protein